MESVGRNYSDETFLVAVIECYDKFLRWHPPHESMRLQDFFVPSYDVDVFSHRLPPTSSPLTTTTVSTIAKTTPSLIMDKSNTPVLCHQVYILVR